MSRECVVINRKEHCREVLRHLKKQVGINKLPRPKTGLVSQFHNCCGRINNLNRLVGPFKANLHTFETHVNKLKKVRLIINQKEEAQVCIVRRSVLIETERETNSAALQCCFSLTQRFKQ